MKRHLDLVQNVTAVIPVVARNDSGTVIDLTGLTGSAITWKLATDHDASPKISLSIGSGIALDAAPTTGKFTITVPASSIDVLDEGRYVHECFLTKSGVTYRPLFGFADVAPDIG